MTSPEAPPALPDAPSGTTAEETRRNLDRSFARGIAWTGAGRWLTQIFNWGATIVVTRILSREDYGIVGMATVYIGLTSLITEFGLSSSVVAIRNMSDEQHAQLNGLAVTLGLLGVAASFVAAFPISWFFKVPAVIPVVMALSSILLLDSLRSVPTALLAKAMRFKYLALVDATKALIVSAMTVTLAYAGFSYWSLVLGTILSSALPTLLIVSQHPVRFRRPRWHELTEAIHYTRNFMVGNISWYVYSNADFTVAGRILGKGPLGDYTLGWTLASAPIERIASVVNRVLPPLFSAVSTDKAALRRYLLKITQAMSLIAVPAAVGLSLVAGDFTRTVLGDKWAGAIGPLRILAFYGLLQALQLVTTPVLMVTGNIRIAARIGLATALILPVGFVLGGLAYGTVGIAAIWVTLYPAILLVTFRATFRVIELHAREYLGALVPSVVAASWMLAAIVLFDRSGVHLAGIWLLIAKIAIGAVTYALALIVGWRKHLREMLNAIRLLR